MVRMKGDGNPVNIPRANPVEYSYQQVERFASFRFW